MARGPLPQSGVISVGGENLVRGPAPYPPSPPGVTSWFSPPHTHTRTHGDELTASSASVETKSWVWGWGGGGVGVGAGHLFILAHWVR